MLRFCPKFVLRVLAGRETRRLITTKNINTKMRVLRVALQKANAQLNKILDVEPLHTHTHTHINDATSSEFRVKGWARRQFRIPTPPPLGTRVPPRT